MILFLRVLHPQTGDIQLNSIVGFTRMHTIIGEYCESFTDCVPLPYKQGKKDLP